MPDRVLFISWGSPVPGREERGLEVFNEVMGLYGQLQQAGRIESFDVVLLNPNGGPDGYIEVHGTHDQLSAVQEDDDFRRTLLDASLVVQDLRIVEGMTDQAIATEMALYQQAISKVPQTA